MNAKRMIVWTGVLMALGYVVFCAFAVREKERLFYPVDGRTRAKGRMPPAGVESWWLNSSAGGRVEAWWWAAPSASAATPAPAVIYFHGNAELIDDQRQLARAWNALGASVLLCEHAGYGRSDGPSSIETDLVNATAWHDRVSARADVRGDAIIVHGFSFGGALAAGLAARRPVAGVVLESTFSSLPSMARRLGVWLYFGGESLDSARTLRELDPSVSVLLTHGSSDAVIPVAEGRALAAARPGARYDEASYPHTPWAQDEPGNVLMRELLASVVARLGDRPGLGHGKAPDNALASPAPSSAP